MGTRDKDITIPEDNAKNFDAKIQEGIDEPSNMAKKDEIVDGEVRDITKNTSSKPEDEESFKTERSLSDQTQDFEVSDKDAIINEDDKKLEAEMQEEIYRPASIPENSVRPNLDKSHNIPTEARPKMYRYAFPNIGTFAKKVESGVVRVRNPTKVDASKPYTRIPDTKPPRYRCKFCPSEYNKSSNASDHFKAKHSDTREYACPSCGKEFKIRSTLRAHLKVTHSDRRDYVCKSCGKAFKLGCNLIKHEKSVHEGVKEHICEDCGNAFSGKSALKVHKESIHQGLKRFKCEQCPYTGYNGGDFKRHMKSVHEKIKDQICEVCGFACSRKEGLRQHREFCPTKNGLGKRSAKE